MASFSWVREDEWSSIGSFSWVREDEWSSIGSFSWVREDEWSSIGSLSRPRDHERGGERHGRRPGEMYDAKGKRSTSDGSSSCSLGPWSVLRSFRYM
jgi:hypothetical protein